MIISKFKAIETEQDADALAAWIYLYESTSDFRLNSHATRSRMWNVLQKVKGEQDAILRGGVILISTGTLNECSTPLGEGMNDIDLYLRKDTGCTENDAKEAACSP
jgi:hypothetical protein